MCRRCPPLAAFVAENIAEINGVPGNAASFDRPARADQGSGLATRLLARRLGRDQLPALLRHQRPGRAAHGEQGSLRQHPPSWCSTWSRRGKVHCLRIDHPDGLYDPAQYFNRLQEPFLACAQSSERESGASEQRPPRPLYVVVEKIVAGYERLPESWSVHGTTGYRFVNVRQWTVRRTRRPKPESNASIEDSSARCPDFDDLLYRSKRLIVRTALAGELNVLANQLGRIAEASRSTCDFTLNGLRDALTEIVACFPVYRTYVTANSCIGRGPALHRLGGRGSQEAEPRGGHQRFRFRARRA